MTESDAVETHPAVLWIVAAALGFIDAILTGGLLFIVTLVLALRYDRGSILAGWLTAFALTWLGQALLRWAANGDDNPWLPWLVLGIFCLLASPLFLILAIQALRIPVRLRR
jgi:putative Ca2+/H+ antiporter (TMEM165/GDT1 family)